MPSQATRTTPEQLYRLLADNATDVVTLHDLDGTYVYVSPSIRTFGGYAPEDLLGRTCWELMHPDDIPAVETEGPLQRLAAIGCDHAQGFLLSRPLPAEQLAELL